MIALQTCFYVLPSDASVCCCKDSRIDDNSSGLLSIISSKVNAVSVLSAGRFACLASVLRLLVNVSWLHYKSLIIYKLFTRLAAICVLGC